MKLTSVELDRSDNGQTVSIRFPGGELTSAVAAELSAAAVSLTEDRAVRVVTLTADGDFCTGPGPDLDVFQFRPDPASAFGALRVPVVVGVGGACRAEGFEVALAADVVVAAPGASFALDHIVRGTVPAWGGSQRLPRAVGQGPAVAMSLLGTEIEGAAAKSLGLVHVISDDLDKTVADLAATLSERGPLALEFTKEAVHRGSEMPLRDGLRLEGDLNHQLAATDDRAEGLAAFFEKRPPDFGGR